MTKNHPQNTNHNQYYLKRAIQLLDVTPSHYYKNTKLQLYEDPIFAKNHPNPSTSKPFFYLSFIFIKHLVKPEELSTLSIWYPPRNVNQQLQFKKSLWKILQNLENSNRIPKNVLLSKNSIMADSKSDQLLEFLRFLSELALRHQYIDQYSHHEKLIQITVPGYSYPTQTPDNDINRFYAYPFVPSESTTNIQLPHNIMEETEQAIKIMRHHIKLYTKKISKLRIDSNLAEMQLPYQQILCKLTEQKQVHETLKQKIPQKILSQNRAFDRRRIISQNEDIWSTLNNHNWEPLQKRQSSILKMEGQIQQILKKWNSVKGIANIIEANSILDKKVVDLKRKFKNSFDRLQKTRGALEKLFVTSRKH